MQINNTIILVFITMSFTQQGPVGCQKEKSDSSKIIWTEDRKLTWADFKKVVNDTSYFTAYSDCSLYFKFEIKRDVLKSYTVYAYFNKERSWAKACPAYLLEHEQLHFDIVELHARKIRKFIHDKDGKLSPEELNNFLKKNTESLIRTNKQYDDTTRHSRDIEAQMHWEDSISQELKSLEGLSSRK